ERPDGGSRADRVLEEWSTVAGTARRPVDPVLERGPLTRLRGVSLATAGVVVAVLVAAVLLGRGGGFQGGGGGLVVSGASSPPPVAPPAPTPVAKPAPTRSPAGVAACTADDLKARVTMWTGGAGQRTASVELSNGAQHACLLGVMAKPLLVDANGITLIAGDAPKGSKTIQLEPKGVRHTLVEAGNYCGSGSPPQPA